MATAIRLLPTTSGDRERVLTLLIGGAMTRQRIARRLDLPAEYALSALMDLVAARKITCIDGRYEIRAAGF